MKLFELNVFLVTTKYNFRLLVFDHFIVFLFVVEISSHFKFQSFFTLFFRFLSLLTNFHPLKLIIFKFLIIIVDQITNLIIFENIPIFILLNFITFLIKPNFISNFIILLIKAIFQLHNLLPSFIS